MINVILCGGSGTRLWPLSREKKPKQFINFSDGKSLLQRTVLGNQQFCSQFMIVCNAEHSYSVQNQLEEVQLEPCSYIFEPIPKNTAAAVCFAMLSIAPEEVALITPADHYINYSEEYIKAVAEAKKYATHDFLAIFGIYPKSPDTGFGYIEVENDKNVKKFHEKPSLKTAKSYLTKGNFYWNSGMICVKAGVFLKQLQQHAPHIYESSRNAFQKAAVTKNQFKILSDEMEKIPSESIDHALLEKADALKCVPGKFEWNDIGSFDSLFSHLPKDGDGNAVDAKNAHFLDSANNLVLGNKRMISLIDIKDLVIVDTPDALLISKIGSTQKVKEVVTQLKRGNTTLHRDHIEDFRPWGSFTVLESVDKYKVKKLVVSPGKRLSLQKHQHRSEHWVVVAGKAIVTIGNEERVLHSNDSIFIPKGEIHRIYNPGDTELVIIEVQYGDYTGEDDIIRIQDDFSRALG